jgi:hypothetical protein
VTSDALQSLSLHIIYVTGQGVYMNLHVCMRACMHTHIILTIKNYTFERVENFKYLGVILNEDNNHQIDLQERIKKC